MLFCVCVCVCVCVCECRKISACRAFAVVGPQIRNCPHPATLAAPPAASFYNGLLFCVAQPALARFRLIRASGGRGQG